MSKIDAGEFKIARRGASEKENAASEPATEGERESPSPSSAHIATLAERREENAALRVERQMAHDRLRALKRAKEREVKRMVNVPLDSPLKARLQRAAMENDVKMTEIIRDALSKYLTENGY